MFRCTVEFSAAVSHLKPEHNSKRNSRIKLAVAKKAGVNGVRLAAQGNAADKVVIDTAAESGSKGEVGVRDAAACIRLERESKQKLAKDPESAVGIRSAGAEEKCVAGTVQAKFSAAPIFAKGCVGTAIVPIQIGHSSQPGKIIAFNRSFPSAHAGAPAIGLDGAAVGETLPVNVGITEKGIAAGRKLRGSEP